VRGEDTIAVPTWRVELLLHHLGVIEDWLLHASDETLAELADFACHEPYGPAVAELIDELGWHQVALRRLLPTGTGQR
jgi:hypothetical protein